MQLEAFVVEAVIVHDVPRTGANQPVVMTDEPIALDDDLRSYFAGKIIASLGERGLDVIADPTSDDSIRAATAEIIASPEALVNASQRMAERLDAIQDARNPAGLLAVVRGKLNKQTCVAILKLEREEGLRVIIRAAHGRRTIDMQHLRDLTLTDKTKVFKTALLLQGAGRGADAVEGQASDDQRSLREGTGVASFFLSRFLGCKLRTSPEVATREFFEATETFINTDVLNPERRARYHISLLAAMEDARLDLQPRSFADRYIDASDRPALLQRVTTAGLDIGTAFEKDLTLIRRRARGFKLVFESGMVLVGGKEDLETRVDVRPDTAANPGADINDTIRRLEGR
jgi:hypothetical protein